MARKTTISDVALASNVSIATVDRVLNGRGGVSPDKERRVFAAARSLGMGRNLSHGFSRTLRVAVLIQSGSNPFHASLRDAFAAEAEVYAGLNLQFSIHHLDPNHAGRTAATIASLGQRHDGLIITSPDGPVIASALSRVSSDIPVVTLATDIPGCGRRAYIGPDDYKAGRVAGDLMGHFLAPVGGDVLMITGLQTISGHRDREAGFRTVLQEYHPACHIVRVAECREDAATAGAIASLALRDYPRLRGIYHASVGAEPVVGALRSRNRGDVVFITHELTEDRRIYLKSRAIRAVVDQKPETEVKIAVKTMAQLLGRIDGEETTDFTPIQIIMAENV